MFLRRLFLAMLGSALLSPVSFSQEKDTPVIDPKEYQACGVNCVYAISHMLGKEADLKTMHALLKPDEDGGNSLADLEEGLRALGFYPVAARLQPDHPHVLSRIPVPAILHVRKLHGQREGNHFIVYLGGEDEQFVLLLDAPRPAQTMPWEWFQDLWTGNVLIPCKTQAEQEQVRARLQEGSISWWREPAFWSACGLMGGFLWLFFRRQPTRRAALGGASA